MKQLVTDGDYTIKVNDGGSVFIDTGNQIGQLYLTGNLVVNGSTTTVTSAELNIDDNIIVVNNGEAGVGVTLGKAGIRVDRGSLPDTQMVFDETVSWNDPVSQTIKTGGFKFEDENGSNIGLQVRSITTGGGDLYLINAGTGVINVSGTNNYEQQVTDDDDIPNKKYVDDSVVAQVAAANFTELRTGSVSLTRVRVLDQEVTGNPSLFEITVDGDAHSNFYANRFETFGLRFSDTTIQTTTSSSDLVLSAPGTGSIVVDDQLHIKSTPSSDDATIDPLAPSDGAIIYTKTQDIGKTGIYYVNSSSTRDEIISKNRSLLFSMIF